MAAGPLLQRRRREKPKRLPIPGPGMRPSRGIPRQVTGRRHATVKSVAIASGVRGLRHEEHELRDRLAYIPYGEERERLQYRLGQVHNEREQCLRR